MFREIAAIALFVAALPAAAQTAADQTPAAAVAKPEKKVCRRVEETGSIMGGKNICHTKAEWTAIDLANGNAASTARDARGAAGGRPVGF